MGLSINVADLFARLGVKVDRASFAAGKRKVEEVGKAYRDANGRWRDANGRFLASAPGLYGVFDRLKKGVGKLVAGLKQLAAYAGISLAATAGAGVMLSDSYTELENRIRQASSSTEEMNELMDRTRAIANATRSDWKATGEAFVRLKNSTKDLGLTTNEQLDVIMTLNMALQSSGASAAEASAGTLQLMQGLAAGALQGDEFRSIAEQLPDLLDMFAKELGVSRAKLKQLGSEGKITSKVVIDALRNSSAEIRDKFVASTATAAQGWVVLKNELTVAAAEFVRSSGIVDGLGSAVRRVTAWIEENRDEIRSFATTTAEVVGVIVDAIGFAVGVVADVIGWFRDGSDEAKAVLIGVATVIAAVVVPALYSLATAWIAALWPILLIIAIVAAIAYGIIKLVKNWDKVKAAGGRAWDWIKQKAVDFWNWIKGLGARIGQAFVSAFEAIVQFGKDIGAAIAAPFVAAFDFVKGLIVGVVNFFIDKVNWLIDKINWLSKKASKLPGISLGTIDRISKVGAPSVAVPASTTGTTNVNAEIKINVDGSKDPKATATEVNAQMQTFFARELRAAEDR